MSKQQDIPRDIGLNPVRKLVKWAKNPRRIGIQGEALAYSAEAAILRFIEKTSANAMPDLLSACEGVSQWYANLPYEDRAAIVRLMPGLSGNIEVIARCDRAIAKAKGGVA